LEQARRRDYPIQFPIEVNGGSAGNVEKQRKAGELLATIWRHLDVTS